MKLKRMSTVVRNRNARPVRKIKSANFSYRILGILLLLIDKKERKLLTIKKSMAIAVNSSMRVASALLFNLREVNTIKHKPRSVADVLSICGDLSPRSSIITEFQIL